VPWARALAVWLVMAAVEIAHGALRRLYVEPFVGDWRARQIGAIVGALLVLAVAILTIRWLGTQSWRTLGMIGLFWLVLMVIFEVVGGRLAAGYSWNRILADYDIARGGLLGVGMAVVAASPLIAARVRRV
jgi:hypothetical protein